MLRPPLVRGQELALLVLPRHSDWLEPRNSSPGK